MYLAKRSTINFWAIITDTFWIHTPYRIGEMRVKWESKNELLRCKKGQTQTARFTLFYWYIYQISSARLKITIYRPAEYQLFPPMQQQR
jgi:hypothetical protein